MLVIIQLAISILILIICFRRGRLISSVSFWVICYEMIFVVAPWALEKQVFSHAKEIEIYSTVGIFLFGVGMLFSRHLIKIRLFPVDSIIYKNMDELPHVFFQAHVAYWVIFVITAVLIIIEIGSNGIRGVFIGSISATTLSLEDTVASSHYYSYSGFLLIPSLLVVWMSAVNDNQKRERIWCLVSFVIIQAVFSFTRVWLICTVTIVLIFEIQKYKEYTKLFFLLAVFIVGILVMSFLNIMRGLGIGNVVLSSVLNYENIISGADFFASYKWFNRLLDIEPPYINPIVYFKPVYAFIPRSIWPSKPSQMSLQILKMLEPALAASGYSTAGNSVLGEGYAVLGKPGIFIWPFVWGLLCERIDKNQYERIAGGKLKCLACLFYYIFAVFIVVSAQRGDWSQYMIQFLWMFMLPAYLLVKVCLLNLRR